MGITAETLGAKYDVTRQDCDEFALLGQHRWAEGTVYNIFVIFGLNITVNPYFIKRIVMNCNF